jgi:hypothetical protein
MNNKRYGNALRILLASIIELGFNTQRLIGNDHACGYFLHISIPAGGPYLISVGLNPSYQGKVSSVDACGYD